MRGGFLNRWLLLPAAGSTQFCDDASSLGILGQRAVVDDVDDVLDQRDDLLGQEGTAARMGDSSSHAASATVVFMMVSNSTGVKRPRAACLRRR